MPTWKPRLMVGGMALLASVGLLAGCTNPSQQAINILKQDPMATVTVPHLKLLSEHQSSVNSWKNPPASFTRCFEVDGITVDEATIALGDLAQAHGWKLPEEPDPITTAFNKFIDFGTIFGYDTKPEDPRDTSASLAIITDPSLESGCPVERPGNLALVMSVGGVTYWSPPE